MIEVEIGQKLILNKGETFIFGNVEGWRVAGGQLLEVLLEGIEEAFRVYGEGEWVIVEEESNDGTL
jgi:hypothetical protein